MRCNEQADWNARNARHQVQKKSTPAAFVKGMNGLH
jgi:hypothetical protein